MQANSSITRTYGGTELGLAICKSLVQAMGGVIGLDSVPDRGSRFWFELPLERGDAAAVDEQTPVAPAEIRPLTVLVADDVAANRELLGEILRRYGHTVHMAEDGAAAVAAVAQRTPDVVLMDIQMPVMDGIEATHRIRHLPGPAARVPILALTDSVMVHDRELYLAAGMDRCLTKPIVWPELFAALAAVAAGQQSIEPISPTAERPAMASSTPETPLLDSKLLAGLASNLPPAALEKLLRRGLDGADQSCGRLHAARHGPAILAQEGTPPARHRRQLRPCPRGRLGWRDRGPPAARGGCSGHPCRVHHDPRCKPPRRSQIQPQCTGRLMALQVHGGWQVCDECRKATFASLMILPVPSTTQTLLGSTATSIVATYSIAVPPRCLGSIHSAPAHIMIVRDSQQAENTRPQMQPHYGSSSCVARASGWPRSTARASAGHGRSSISAWMQTRAECWPRR